MAESNIQYLVDDYNNLGMGRGYSRGFTQQELDTGLYTAALDPVVKKMEEQEKENSSWKLGKAVYNGFVVNTAQGLQGIGQMLIDNRAAELQGEGYAVDTDVTDHAMEVAEGSKWNSVLEKYNVKGDTLAGQIGLDLAEGGGQLLSQILVTAATGGTGGAVFMGSQIAGQQYTELRKKGVSSERAIKASLANAIVQGYLEKFGLDKIMKGGAFSTTRQKMVSILESIFSEGITEGIQEFPEQITNIWAENQGKSLREMARKWDENAEENIKAMLYSGFIGGVLGGGARGSHIMLMSTQEYAANKYHEHLVNEQGKRIESQAKRNMSPEEIVASVNESMPDEKVSIEALKLQEYFQTKDAAEVAAMLGVTQEEVDQAAENGMDVVVNKGNYEGTAAKYKDFFESTKEHIAFGDGDYTVNEAKLKKALRAQYQDLTDTIRQDLDNEVDKIVESAVEAGVTKEQSAPLRTLLLSRAMIANPENPGQFFRDHPLEFNNAGKVNNALGLYEQRAFHGSTKEFDKFSNKELKHGIYGYGHYFTADEFVARGYGNLRATDFEYEGRDGVVYETEIPENDTLIDQNVPLIKQVFFSNDDFVSALEVSDNKEAAKIVREAIANGKNGRELYDSLSDFFDSDEKASEYLYSNLGALGMTYDGGPDGRCYIIFDEAYIDIVKRKRLNDYNVEEIVKYFTNKDNYKNIPTIKVEGIPEGLQNSSKEDMYKFAQKKYNEFKGMKLVDPLGNELYFEPGSRQEDAENEFTYLLHFLAGKGATSVNEIEFPRLIGFSMLDKTVTDPNAIIRQKDKIDEETGKVLSKGRNMYVAIFDGGQQISGQVVVGVERGEAGRLVTSFVRVNSTRHKNNALDNLRDHIKNAETIYYIKDEKRRQTETAAATADQRVSQSAAELHSSGKFILPQSINKVKLYNQQNSSETKGAISWEEDGRAIINLFKGSDASTVIHETGHYFVEAFMQDSGMEAATPQAKRDRAALLKYVGMSEEQWNNASFEEKRAAHEKLAEGFETYIMEGKAPNRELRSVFKRFADWLKAVYKSIYRNPNAAEINDEVRGVFDRWLASEEEIAAVERIDGYFAKLPDVITNNLSEKNKENLQDFIAKAHDKAVELITKDSMINFTAERRAKINAYRKEVRPQVEEEVAERLLYQAMEDLRGVLGNRNIKVLAGKYLNPVGRQWTDWRKAKAEVDEKLNQIIYSVVDDLKEDLKEYNPRKIWVNKETNERDVDVSDLKEELLSGIIYEQEWDVGTDIPWLQSWFEKNGKRKPTVKELQQIAYDLYIGKDEYGVNSTENLNGLSKEELADIEAQQEANKVELDNLLKLKEVLADEKKAAKLFEGEYQLSKSFNLSLSPEESVLFDEVAEYHGYESGDAMAKAILSEPSYKQAVNKAIEDLVQQKFPDIYREREAAENAAREALYNDESGLVIGVEQQLIEDYAAGLQGKQRSIEARTKLAKQRKAQAELAAKAEISRMSMKEALRTRKFVMAERRAAANAKEALASKDYEGAITYKQQQALNHALVRESLKMRQEVKRSVKYLRRLRTKKKETWGNEQHFSQAAELMQRMGIGHKSYNPEMRTQTLAEYVQEMAAHYDCVAIPAWIQNEAAVLNNPQSMNFEQYQDCVNALRNIQAVVKAEQYMVAVAKNLDYAQFKQEASENLNKLKNKYTAVLGEKQKAGMGSKAAASLRNTDNLFEFMDNWTYGFFSKNFMAPLKHAADKEWAMVNAVEEFAEAAYKEWLPNKTAIEEADRKVAYEELGNGDEGSVGVADKHTLVRMLANLGNAGNMRVLCSKPPITLENCQLWVRESENVTAEQAIEQTRENLVNFLSKYLTAADVKYAQSLIDNADRQWNELADLERRTKGFAPIKVEATPLTLTLANGDIVTMRGGYFPLVRNTEMGSHPQGVEMLSSTEDNPGQNIMTMHTNTGSSKARVNAEYPIDLSRGAEMRSINDTIHDICYREVMSDFRKILNDPEMYALFKTKLGIATFQQFREMLEKTAQPKSYGMDLAEGTHATVLNWLRRKTVNAAIMLNVKTSLQNLGNIFLYGNVVDGFDYKDVVAGIGRYGVQGLNHTGNNELNQLCSKSVFMKQRVLLPDITMAEVQGENVSKIDKQVAKWGALMLSYTDNITAKPMWAQAYSKKINEGMSEQEAIDFADTVVRRTLGSGRVQDVSSLQRGGPLWKLFTSFQGFFNTQYNQWEREANIDYNLFKEGKRAELALRLTAFVASKYLFTCMAALMLGLENPFKKDDDGWYKLSKEMMGYPASMAGPVGQAGYQLINSIMGIRTYGYRMAAIQSTIDRGFKLGRSVNRVAEGKDDWTSIIEPMTGVINPAIGIPDQLNKWFWNGYDIIVNDMSPEFGDLLRRRPKAERK